MQFLRDETSTFVSSDYSIDEERQCDVFNAFVCVRALHREAESHHQHPHGKGDERG